MTPEHERILWRRHLRRDCTATSELVEEATPAIRRIAQRVAQTHLPPDIPLTIRDLYQEGVVGLLEAMERWKPHKGARLLSFALHRARGAMVDAIRSADFVPRAARMRGVDIQLEPLASDYPVALSTAPEVDEFWRHIAATRGLTPKQWQTVAMYYREGLTLRVIGERLGVVESRSHQLLAEAHQIIAERSKGVT